MFSLISDDEDISLVMECPVVPDPDQLEVNQVDPVAPAEIPADDTLSMGPDTPELPLDGAPDLEDPEPSTTLAYISLTEEAHPGDDVMEEEGVEEQVTLVEMEESTVREVQVSSSDPQTGIEEQVSAEQVVEEREEEEETGAQEAQALSEEGEEGEALVQTKPEGVEMDLDSEEPTTAVEEPLEGATGPVPAEEVVEVVEEEGQQVVVEAKPRRVDCCCPARASPPMRSALRRKNRPCSLPVSELETVIASSCGDPETPRTHYIRIHHLLHSLPSARQRQGSGEEEEVEEEGGSSTEEPTIKPTSKDGEEGEGEEEEEEEGDASQSLASPSQVRECTAPCCRSRTLPRSLSIERLSELNQLLDGGERGGRTLHPRLENEEAEGGGGGRGVRGSECELCDNSCYSTSCYSTSCYSTSCYSNSGYEGRNRPCSHTRLSSVDSTRLSESTVFSSQDEEEEEEENSAFESVPDSIQSPDTRDPGGDGTTAEWREETEEGTRGESGESPVAGPSDRTAGGEMLFIVTC